MIVQGHRNLLKRKYESGILKTAEPFKLGRKLTDIAKKKGYIKKKVVDASSLEEIRLPPLDATSSSEDEIIPPKKRRKTATCTVSKPDHDNGKEDDPEENTVGDQNESRDFGHSSDATVDLPDLVSTNEVKEKHDSVTNNQNDLDSTKEYSDGVERTEEEPNHVQNGKNNRNP